MDHTLSQGNARPNDKYEVFVPDYQGQAGNAFRVYFQEQAAQNLYGSLTPCSNTTARPEIDGITWPLATNPPSAPTNLQITVVSGTP